MIKIDIPDEPKVLTDHKTAWTNALMDAVSKYGGYSNIPKDEKDKLLSHYRHPDIQKLLFESSHHKCAFCECKPAESGNIEVEHFYPKSLYPGQTFEWSNYLPSCRKCNEAKLDFDTKTEPIINPAKEDPSQYLTYSFVNIIPSSDCKDLETAKRTVEVCNLNCLRLYEARSKLLTSIAVYMDELSDKLILINEADTQLKKHRRITKLKNSLDTIDSLMNPDSPYSGYARWLIEQNPVYHQAKKIIQDS